LNPMGKIDFVQSRNKKSRQVYISS